MNCRVSSLDVLVAAHVLLLINPPFPDTLLKDLLSQSYPSLVSLSRRVYSAAFESSNSDITFAPTTTSLWALFPSWPEKRPSTSKESPNNTEDLHYTHMRWGFLGLVLGSLAAYLVLVGRQYQITWKVAGVDDNEDAEEVLETGPGTSNV